MTGRLNVRNEQETSSGKATTGMDALGLVTITSTIKSFPVLFKQSMDTNHTLPTVRRLFTRGRSGGSCGSKAAFGGSDISHKSSKTNRTQITLVLFLGNF